MAAIKLSELTATLRIRDKKVNLRTLASFVKATITKVDPFEWEEFEQVVCEKFRIDSVEFRSKFSPPTFLRDGFHPDEIREWLDSCTLVGFPRRYADHFRNTESPASFHLFSALTILGAALRRQVWVDQQIFRIWPTMHVLLLGPSGQTAKSTCGNIAIRILERSERTRRIANRITLEALYRGLNDETAKSGEACGIIYASEMSTMFTKNESYNQGLIQVLTDLFDCPDKVDNDTKTSGNDRIRNVGLSFLGGSNEGWASFLDEAAMMGGYLGRHLVAYQEGAVRSVAFPQMEDPTETDALVHMLKLTQFITGDFALSDNARDWYQRKYSWLKVHWPDDERIHGFWARYGVHLLRLGMLFRVGEMVEAAHDTKAPLIAMPRTIEIRHLEWADYILTWMAQQMPRILFALGTTKQGEEMGKIVRFVARQGGRTTEGALMRAMLKKMAPRTLHEHLETLVKSKVLCPVTESIPLDGTMGYELKMGLEEI